MESELPNRGLIVIVGVEVGEVCVGVGLPGKLWVEVLISFLQNQIVFVEGLLDEKKKKRMERRKKEESVRIRLGHMDQVIIQPRWQSKSKSI